jgi:hypothetical protein
VSFSGEDEKGRLAAPRSVVGVMQREISG